MENLSNNLTVFLISVERTSNYTQCLDALSKQTVEFKLEHIKGITPMSAAFQKMIDNCKTKYYIQVDEDMILNENAIEIMYTAIIKTEPKTAIVCFKLLDHHLNYPIQGVKIYKHSIFKKYPYKNVVSCEMNQLQKMEKDGYSFMVVDTVLGIHSPYWTDAAIYNRYYNFLEREKLHPEYEESILPNLWEMTKRNPTELNLFALMGAFNGLINTKISSQERDYSKQKTVEFNLLETFLEKPTSFHPERLLGNRKKVVQLANLPCANSGFELAKLFNGYSTKYESRYILSNEYSKQSQNIPFRAFPKDLFFKNQKEECIRIIKEAEIIHIHHDFEIDEIKEYIKDKPVIWTAYNLINSLSHTKENTWQYKQNQLYYKKMREFSNLITVADQPLQKIAFSDLTTTAVPLINYLWDFPKTIKSDTIHVVFAPTNRDRTGIGRKMYYEVLEIINKLQKQLNFTFDLIEGAPREENLQRKSLAHIIIDDVDPDFEKSHNTSIEACFFGAVPLTNYSTPEYPFLKTNIHTLEETLISLITNKKLLNKYSLQMSEWINRIYTPQNLLKRYERIYDKMVPVNSEYEIKKFLTVLNDKKVDCWLLQQSALDCMKYNAILGSTVMMGARNFENKNIITDIIDSEKLTLNVNVIIEDRKTKVHDAWGIPVQIPMPIIKYLEKEYNKSFSKLMEKKE